MKTRTNSDTYTTSYSYPMDEPRRKCLMLLYQPIIGSSAVNLYMTLLEDSSLNEVVSLHSRLIKLSQLTMEQLQEAMKKLQAVGLLKVFHKDNHYLYELLLPMTPNQLYHHQVLNTLLFKVLGKEEYLKTKNHFLVKLIDKNVYQEEKISFNDVFDIQLLNNQNVIQVKEPIFDITKSKLQATYSRDIFFEGMEVYQITSNQLTEGQIELIDQLGMLYQIPMIDMQAFVKENFIQGVFHEQAFHKTCQDYYQTKVPETLKEVYHHQSVVHTSTGGSGEEQKHIYYLETTSPYELLKAKQGGKEPVKRELQLIESLLIGLGLEQGVINVLIEFTLSQCDGALAQKFMEYHGAKWQRKNIKTVQEAMMEAKKELLSITKEPSWKTQKEENIQENIDTDSLEELLSKYN
ncbi:DnaD domain protein [Tannockella kyphosi]|uniref:DnaD domain protein n=1 Tax=Tannockella kyphosi TaxID=2899121 RepID=UPI002011EDB4|nr:DnaD domain protein [Tannockella kyphosi]